ncbi:hypothetical protein I7I53_04835 [Histoplasma capsulatum var. duboisii H88]|uniref:Uncharacterized protein n=1 Tax=Ajellomyces capsulatus (strain H88) TaxID=544711 RepID=A0A8A1LRN5_AJEC8|nr:hypothetical protein I7I53_04835 [Histoplasma capsulatum var. duboisii H88]
MHTGTSTTAETVSSVTGMLDSGEANPVNLVQGSARAADRPRDHDSRILPRYGPSPPGRKVLKMRNRKEIRKKPQARRAMLPSRQGQAGDQWIPSEEQRKTRQQETANGNRHRQ